MDAPLLNWKVFEKQEKYKNYYFTYNMTPHVRLSVGRSVIISHIFTYNVYFWTVGYIPAIFKQQLHLVKYDHDWKQKLTRK